MVRFPKWNWKPSHFGPRDSKSIDGREAAVARACLPSVEKLDSRVLMSVSSSDILIIKQIDKSTPVLAITEANAISSIKGESADDNYKGEIVVLGNDLFKLNSIFLKYETDILNQKVTPTEGADVASGINDIFVKINVLATDLSIGNPDFLPAVQKIFDAALGTNQDDTDFPVNVLGDLTTLANSDLSSITPDAASIFNKMGDDLWKMSNAVVGYKMDLAQGIPGDVALKQATDKVNVEYLKIQLEEVLVSSYLSDEDNTDLSNIIDSAKIDILNAIQPPDIGVSFTGGVTVPGGAGDTIV